MSSRWVLVRHGETEWNNEGRAQGQADTPLNMRGQAQAELVGTRLAVVDFAAAYSSDSQRAVNTAAPIMRNRKITLNKMETLREKHFGDWEGMTFAEIEVAHPEMFRRLFDEDIYFSPENGESDMALYQRIQAVADQLLQAHAGDDNSSVLVVAHGGSLRALIACLLKMPAQYMWRLKLANCGITVVSVYDDGGVTLDLLNDTSHLGDCFTNPV